jgi:Flp pilus assembly protein TadG
MKTSRRNRRFNPGGDRGQSMVEFVVVLPILVMLLLAIWQCGVAFHNYIAITDAARVGARAAAVNRSTDPCQAAKDAIQATVSGPQWTQMNVTCPTPPGAVGTPYTVSIDYPFQINVLIARPPVTMSTSATERLE